MRPLAQEAQQPGAVERRGSRATSNGRLAAQAHPSGLAAQRPDQVVPALVDDPADRVGQRCGRQPGSRRSSSACLSLGQGKRQRSTFLRSDAALVGPDAAERGDVLGGGEVAARRRAAGPRPGRAARTPGRSACCVVLVMSSASTASRHASALAAAVGRAARAAGRLLGAGDRCCRGRASAAMSASSSRPEPGQVGTQQPAQVGVDHHPVRDAVPGQPAVQPVRGPAGSSAAVGERPGQGQLQVRAGRGRGQQLRQPVAASVCSDLGASRRRGVAVRGRARGLAEQVAHGRGVGLRGHAAAAPARRSRPPAARRRGTCPRSPPSSTARASGLSSDGQPADHRRQGPRVQPDLGVASGRRR